VEIAKPVTKWAVQLKEPAQAPWVFREAFRIARSGRPGPVLIDLPIDVAARVCVSTTRQWTRRCRSPSPSPGSSRVRAAIEMLLDAERPLILAGGGVIGAEAWEELRDLASTSRCRCRSR